jgi:mRNA interferase MazF
VAAVTSNLRLGDMPGNVRLRQGEAGLPRASVVNVSQLRTVHRTRPHELGVARMHDVLKGLPLLLGTNEFANGGT